MKKRVFKKYVNRFIVPLIKNLPKTETRTIEIKEGDLLTLINNNHTIVNGKKVAEGCAFERNHNTIKSIKETAEVIKEILNKYKYVFVRVKAELYHGNVYLRLITEKDGDR